MWSVSNAIKDCDTTIPLLTDILYIHLFLCFPSLSAIIACFLPGNIQITCYVSTSQFGLLFSAHEVYSLRERNNRRTVPGQKGSLLLAFRANSRCYDIPDR